MILGDGSKTPIDFHRSNIWPKPFCFPHHLSFFYEVPGAPCGVSNDTVQPNSFPKPPLYQRGEQWLETPPEDAASGQMLGKMHCWEQIGIC